MNTTKKRMTDRWQQILTLAHNPISAYKLSTELGLKGQLGIRDSCNALITLGYLEKIDVKGELNRPALLYKTLIPLYNRDNFESDIITVKQAKEKVIRNKASEEIPPNVRRISSDDFHVRIKKSREKVWAGVHDYV